MPGTKSGRHMKGMMGWPPTCIWSLMTSAHVHPGNDGGAVMAITPELMFVENFSAADVDVQTDLDGGTETAIVMTHSGLRGLEQFRIDTLLTLDQAEDYALTLAHVVAKARKRMSG